MQQNYLHHTSISVDDPLGMPIEGLAQEARFCPDSTATEDFTAPNVCVCDTKRYVCGK